MVGDEQHGDEGQDRDDRRLQAIDGNDDKSESGGEAVGRRRGRHPDHDGGDESEGTALQSLLPDAVRTLRRRRQICHDHPFGDGWPVPYPIDIGNASSISALPSISNIFEARGIDYRTNWAVRRRETSSGSDRLAYSTVSASI